MKYEIDGETLLYREYFFGILTLALIYQDDEYSLISNFQYLGTGHLIYNSSIVKF